MKKIALAIPALCALALAGACDGGGSENQPPPTPGVDGGGADGAPDGTTPARPSLDPKSGSFAAARTKAESVLQQARAAGLAHPNRLLPLRDPLFVVNALQELRRAASTECQASQFGCPNPQSAVALIEEYKQNKTAIAAALKGTIAIQQGWGRIALASLLLGYLNVLEQAKGMTAEEATDVKSAAKAFEDALATTPIKADAGMYPLLPQTSTLYRFAFGQVGPAPGAPAAAVTAAGTFIDAVLARLGALAIGPKPEDPLKGLVGRVKQGIIVQGIIVQGIIVQGSEAEQVFDALPYFYSFPSTAQSQKVDAYIAALDDLVDKTSKGTITPGDWSAFAPKADELDAALDYAAGALGASSVAPAPIAGALKPIDANLENDPNVQERRVLTEPTELVDVYPIMSLRTWPALAPGDRRGAIDLPTEIADVTLPPRTSPRLATELFGDAKTRKVDKLHVAWGVDHSKVRIDHVDLRVENLTTKKTIFHKVYRADPADQSIAVRTVVPLEQASFGPGVNDLQVRLVAVDRLGASSGIVCGSLAVENDIATPWGVVPDASATAGKCFTRATATDVTPLGLEGGLGGYDVVVSKLEGGPYRPGFIQKGSVRVYNDTPTPRRLRSLFTAEYTEFLPIDLAMLKSTATPAGIPPLDSGAIAPGAVVTIDVPASTPTGFLFALVDETSAPKYRMFIRNGAHPFAPKW
ncbi:MAG: hypothetical protein JST00_08945 [Deltaproteobacteria bacterium]|nr:hypothetical protein [Deltaproteobacteria bacterium]